VACQLGRDGLAGFLMAFAAHGRARRPVVIDVSPAPLAVLAATIATSADGPVPAAAAPPRRAPSVIPGMKPTAFPVSVFAVDSAGAVLEDVLVLSAESHH
jgi:hypothetical protein